MRIVYFLVLMLTLLQAEIGRVGAVEGSAVVVRASERIKVKSGMALEPKDAIRTESKSKVQVIMKDDTVITIGPESAFSLEAYQFDTPDAGYLDMKLESGFFRAITGKIGKIAPERFKLRTRSATIGIRGTDFGAFVDDENERIGCFSGAIAVTAADGVYELDAMMMIELHEKVWNIYQLDIGRFQSVLARAEAARFDGLFALTHESIGWLSDLSQQQQLQSGGLTIEPGYTLQTPPPHFVP